MTSVDIEEVVKAGGCVVNILEGFLCNNLEHNPPLERLNIDMTENRIKIKRQ